MGLADPSLAGSGSPALQLVPRLSWRQLCPGWRTVQSTCASGDVERVVIPLTAFLILRSSHGAFLFLLVRFVLKTNVGQWPVNSLWRRSLCQAWSSALPAGRIAGEFRSIGLPGPQTNGLRTCGGEASGVCAVNFLKGSTGHSNGCGTSAWASVSQSRGPSISSSWASPGSGIERRNLRPHP